MKGADAIRNAEELHSSADIRAALQKLVQDATHFETLSNRPLVITRLETSEVVYASSMVDRYLGFSHIQYKAEGAAYIARYFGNSQKDWVMQVNAWRKDFHEAILSEPAMNQSPFYTYDVEVNSPDTGFLHKLVVRSACISVADTRFLATTYFDVSALKRSKKLFFHSKAETIDDTCVKDMELDVVRKEPQMLTGPEAKLVRLLRVVSPEIAAQQLNLQPGTIQAKLKTLCRKTDSIGLHGLVQVCDAMGWC